MSESESLVERVARAIDPGLWAFVDTTGPDYWSSAYGSPAQARAESLRRAKAAVLAMREPTEAMLTASIEALPAWREGLDPDEKLLRHVIKDGRGYTEATVPEKHAIRFRAAIDAALA